ncbi:hypothetical protein CVIRNUC_002821 [Coccomyxa viridis]|uniref:Uncharacterized protein n=1 Tax=Coccomyxa viridis TaxID=1274662 RepID=A0AAV1HYR0_9CHLO|nr:hypothetical protein CVIRNUC_002821 [Coccomyxa viridis]
MQQEDADEEEVDYDFDEQADDLTGRGDAEDLAPDDLYGDLYAEESISHELKSLNLEQLQQRVAELMKANRQLEQTLQSVSAERNELRGENAVLIRNISCIFKTARMELDRKDQELHKLRQPPGPPPQTTLGREISQAYTHAGICLSDDV